MTKAGVVGLRIVLVLGGAFIAFTGVDAAFGGIRTLGLQGGAPFLAVTDEHAFLVHDSHVRFLGGLWLGVGLLFIRGATDLGKHRRPLEAAFALIFLGGLSRLTQMHPEITFGAGIVGSFLAEVAGMPLLGWWLAKAVAGLEGEWR